MQIQINKVLRTCIFLLGLSAPFMSYAENAGLSDSEIRNILIQRSVSSYPGNCPCPYNHASNGSRCGKRSAWSRAGGYSPLCYPRDIPESAVNEYRKNMETQ